MEEMSKEEWEAWRSNPITKAFLRFLAGLREGHKERWANGEFTHQEHFGTAIANARAIGEADMLLRIIELEYEDIKEVA